MKKLILASISGIALLGLAACSDTDETTTQGVQPEAPATTPDPGAAPTDPATPPATTPPATEPAPAQ
ncbi:hypothetical protein [Aquamicrobium sp. LC103]|uniref:hypothetical protein n=1 Tax=Aquamicrobium sp. LC103 TaxID=1120658 RepID=UPI00063E9C71|nr:hypothetical protein [Aquamicrobium sp. LC103]TKT80162.1 hypothetical protein XW59_007390 [Aquamicrobium sp. LC103]